MHRMFAIFVSLLAAIGFVGAEDLKAEASPTLEVPRLMVWTRALLPGMDGYDDSIADKNPHEVTVTVRSRDGVKSVLTRYTVYPREPGEWVTETWGNYRFQINVRLFAPEESTVRVVTSLDSKRLADQVFGLMIRPKVYDAEDPEVLRDRLNHAEKRASSFFEMIHRVRTAQFRPNGENWLDANCTLIDDQWNLTNEWVARELDPDLVKAQYPLGLNTTFDRQAEEFFAQWRDGDRLFSYGTPPHLQGPVSGEWGYIIVRDCRVVAKLMTFIS